MAEFNSCVLALMEMAKKVGLNDKDAEEYVRVVDSEFRAD